MSETDQIDTAAKIITALSHGTATQTMYADSLLQVVRRGFADQLEEPENDRRGRREVDVPRHVI